MLSVPLCTSGLHYSRWKSGGICQVLSTEAFTLFCHDVHGFTVELLSFFVTFVIVSCSRVCLLVVSRHLGLTLRPFAAVCSCHQDSLTRKRLAIVQEGVRVFLFSVFSIGSARDDMCPVFSGSQREMSLQAMLKYEGPAASSNCFSLFHPFLESALFLTIYSGCAWARSKCDTSWCVECTLQDWWRTNPTNLLNTDSLCRVCFMHFRVYFLSHCSLWLVVDYFLLIEFLCQAGYVNGNPSGSWSENRSKRPSWRSGSSTAVTLLTDRTLWISLTQTIETVRFSSLGSHEASR